MKSLKTKNLREARGSLGRIDETLRLIERGRFEVPIDVDPAEFVLSDGKSTSPNNQQIEQRIRLNELIATASQPQTRRNVRHRHRSNHRIANEGSRT